MLSFLMCRRMWDFNSPHRQNLEPIGANVNLWFGSAIHRGLELFYGEGAPIHAGFREYIDKKLEEGAIEQGIELDSKLELGLEMLKGYKNWTATEDKVYFDKVIQTEFEFKLPILDPEGNETGDYYVGTIDGIVEDDLGRYWLLEHKTASSISVDHLAYDMQIVAYMYAAQQIHDIKIEGVLYNTLLKKTPTTPKTVYSGKHLSTAKNIKTTYEHYYDCLVEHYGSEEKIPMDRYEEILGILKRRGNDFFHRVRVRKTQAEMEDVAHRIYLITRDMKDPTIYPNCNKFGACPYLCDFKEVCIEMNTGRDASFILDSMYQEREKRY